MRVGRMAMLLVLAVLLPAGAVAQSTSVPPSDGPPLLSACAALGDVPTATPLPAASPGASPPPVELTVFAAASLRVPLEAAVGPLRSATGIVPSHSFDASTALRTQIEQGAPADVFASADTANVLTLVEGGHARDADVFACNQLAVIVPAGNPAAIVAATDLGRPGVAVVAAGDEVPITRYARQLVANLGIADAYAANIVSREDNVAAVRTRIELGEADAGIVYRTDAIASGDLVEQVPVPPEANVPATYAAAIVATTDQPDVSATYLDWLTGTEGQALLTSHGFLPAP